MPRNDFINTDGTINYDNITSQLDFNAHLLNSAQLIGNKTINIYIDPISGNDSNDGSTSAMAVKTITKAIGLIPAVSNGVTVNVASGTYTEMVSITNKLSNIDIIIQFIGTESTLDNGTITTSANMHNLTDISKVWTTNQYKGKFCRITSGIQNGVVYPIMGNTNNTLDITYAGLDIPVGSTYQIFDPVSIIDAQNIRNKCIVVDGSVSVLFKSFKIINSTYMGIDAESGVIINLENCYFENNSYEHAYSAYANHAEYKSCYFKGDLNLSYGVYGTYEPQHFIFCGFDGFNKSGAQAIQYYIAESSTEECSFYNCNRGIMAMGSRYVKLQNNNYLNCTYGVYVQFNTMVYVLGSSFNTCSEGVRSELLAEVFVDNCQFNSVTIPINSQLQGKAYYNKNSTGNINAITFSAEYESAWTSCTASVQSVFTHNFGFIPKSIDVLWGDSSTPTVYNKDNSTWSADATTVTITPAQTKYYKVRAFMV